MNTPIPFRILDIDLFERGVVLRLPFRFGIVTLTACPQAFVRVRIATAAGVEATGCSAELLAPKWFDKNPRLSNEDNFDQLRDALRLAREAYLSESAPNTAFGHFASHYQSHIDAAARHALNPLVACFGPAQLDKAMLDALCRAQGISFYDAMRVNAAGVDARLTPDLAAFDIDAFLASRQPAAGIAARHTVGLVDAIDADDERVRVDDGLPETLEEVVAAYGHRHFKLKVSGDTQADLARLTRIARVLDKLPGYVVTLDGNEQFKDAEAARQFWHEASATPALRRLSAATIYIEQPLPRASALDSDMGALAASRPVIIDESDSTLHAFERAIACGYAGVSSKACKGIYRSILNAARCEQLNVSIGAVDGNPRYFMSAEDLTTQAGLAVQQDLALVNLLGLTHVERNGHHYVDGFAGQGAGPRERQGFLDALPGLYAPGGDNVRLVIEDGVIDLTALAGPGFASGAAPDWDTLQALDMDTVANHTGGTR